MRVGILFWDSKSIIDTILNRKKYPNLNMFLSKLLKYDKVECVECILYLHEKFNFKINIDNTRNNNDKCKIKTNDK